MVLVTFHIFGGIICDKIIEPTHNNYEKKKKKKVLVEGDGL